MAKYIIEMDEPRDCQGCSMWGYNGYADVRCFLNENVCDDGFFEYWKEIHKDCPLRKVEE